MSGGGLMLVQDMRVILPVDVELKPCTRKEGDCRKISIADAGRPCKECVNNL